MLDPTIATITVACEVHGDVDLPGDAVYLRHRAVHPARDGFTPPKVWCALVLCHGHVISRPVSPASRGALQAAGAMVIDEATALLLLRLASPRDAALASRALEEVDDLALLRRRAAVQAGRHWLAADDDTGKQHTVAVATAFVDRVEALGGGQ